MTLGNLRSRPLNRLAGGIGVAVPRRRWTNFGILLAAAGLGIAGALFLEWQQRGFRFGCR